METLIVLKPGWEKLGLISKITDFCRSKNAKMCMYRQVIPPTSFWEEFCLADYSTSSPCMFIKLTGNEIVMAARKDFGGMSEVHISDSEESAKKEIELFKKFSSQNRL